MPVCIRAYAVGAADDRKEPSGDWSLNNLSQSNPGIPSKEKSRAVGTEYSTSIGILQVNVDSRTFWLALENQNYIFYAASKPKYRCRIPTTNFLEGVYLIQ